MLPAPCSGRSIPGALPNPQPSFHFLHFLDRGLRAGDDVVLGVVVLVDAVGQLVEDRVAGDDQGLVQAHLAEVLLAVVEEGATADVVGGRAVVGAVQAVPGLDRGRGGGHLERRAGRVLALGDPVQDRLVPVDQLPVLLLGDAAVPDAGVIRGRAGHGDHPAGGGHHDRRAGRGVRAARLLGLADGVGQHRLHVALEPGVDAGDQVITGLGGGVPDHPELLAGVVHGQHLLAGGALQLLVVLRLQAGLADQVHARRSRWWAGAAASSAGR